MRDYFRRENSQKEERREDQKKKRKKRDGTRKRGCWYLEVEDRRRRDSFGRIEFFLGGEKIKRKKGGKKTIK